MFKKSCSMSSWECIERYLVGVVQTIPSPVETTNGAMAIIETARTETVSKTRRVETEAVWSTARSE
jgi:hypothetical protein